MSKHPTLHTRKKSGENEFRITGPIILEMLKPLLYPFLDGREVDHAAVRGNGDMLQHSHLVFVSESPKYFWIYGCLLGQTFSVSQEVKLGSQWVKRKTHFRVQRAQLVVVPQKSVASFPE